MKHKIETLEEFVRVRFLSDLVCPDFGTIEKDEKRLIPQKTAELLVKRGVVEIDNIIKEAKK